MVSANNLLYSSTEENIPYILNSLRGSKVTAHFHFWVNYMKVILRHKDLHAYGKICESVHKTASANKIYKHKRSFVKV